MIKLLNKNDCERVLDYLDRLPLKEDSAFSSKMDLKTFRDLVFTSKVIMVGEEDETGTLKYLLSAAAPVADKTQKSMSLMYYSENAEFVNDAVRYVSNLLKKRYSKIKVNISNPKSRSLLEKCRFVKEIEIENERIRLEIYSYFFI